MWGLICLQRQDNDKLSSTFFSSMEKKGKKKSDDAESHQVKIIKGIHFPTRENSLKLRETQQQSLSQSRR